MPLDDEVQNALLAIHSRLGSIEGKVNLVARADRLAFLQILEETVRKQPLVGQIYLLLDGKRSQRELREKLLEFGIQASQPTVSRRMTEMETDHGMVDLVQGGAIKIYRKDREMEQILNLTRNIRKWLEDENQEVPEQATRRRARKS